MVGIPDPVVAVCGRDVVFVEKPCQMLEASIALECPVEELSHL